MMVSRREELVTGSMIVALRMSILVVLGGPGYNGITNQRLSSNSAGGEEGASSGRVRFVDGVAVQCQISTR
jgi:hypothetical protein